MILKTEVYKEILEFIFGKSDEESFHPFKKKILRTFETFILIYVTKFAEI